MEPRNSRERMYARRRRAVGILLVLAVAAAVPFLDLDVHDPDTGGGEKAVRISSQHALTGSSASTSAPTPRAAGTAGTSHVPRTPHPIPGYLLIADRGNSRALLVGSHKRILWQYPRPGTTPSMPFYFDDDAFFNARHTKIISQQEEQQTIEVISFPQGRLVWRYGHVDVRGSSPGYLSTPDDAYLLPNGIRTVADVRNCRILFISSAGRVVRQYGTTGACGHDPPRLLGLPNGDTPLPNGGTLVTEIDGSWIDGIGPSGNLMWSFRAPVGYPSDAQWLGEGKVLLADYSIPGHIVIMRTNGKVLWKYGPPSGPGELNHPSLALMLPNGLIAVNDDYRHRVVLIRPSQNRIVWQYGHTDSAGTGPGYLNTPDGMDFLPFNVAMNTPAIRRAVLRRTP